MKKVSTLTGKEIPPLNEGLLETPSWPLPVQLLQKREKLAQLLRLFSSARKRPGLTSDEVLIFFAIGYLNMSISKDVVLMRPTTFIDIALLLGIPKETIRRKTMRLVDIDYVGITRKGIFIKQFEIWCRMFERSMI